MRNYPQKKKSRMITCSQEMESELEQEPNASRKIEEWMRVYKWNQELDANGRCLRCGGGGIDPKTPVCPCCKGTWNMPKTHGSL